ncbi:MAG: hypothetical protein HY924_00475 [Elusimicrobia bacterium]|nr:hypothetical protein [Elusimicrobiota bacterium]
MTVETRSLILKAYAWLFLLSGAVFILLTGALSSGLDLAAAMLPLARPSPHATRTLWLGLTGSMMAMIAYLSLTLAADPRQVAAWRTLLLSKAVSTLLFLCFAALERNTLFLIGAFFDGGILVHLAWLSSGACVPADPLSPASGTVPDCVHEAWFLKANDPSSKDAVWLRYTLERSDSGLEGRVWYAVFDARERRVLSGSWTEPEACACHGLGLCRVGDQRLTRGSASADGPDASWRLSWKDRGVPAFDFVPSWLYAWGLAGTSYTSAVPAALFDGEVRVSGRTYAFRSAPGSVGHLWGRRKAHSWRWLHAAFPDRNGGVEAVFELLSAKGSLGPLVLPRVTRGFLWRKGRVHESSWLKPAGTEAQDHGWRFSLGFDGFSAQGSCAPALDLIAVFEYPDAHGGPLTCRNSKAGSVQLELRGLEGGLRLASSDSAAVEVVERAS